MDAVVLDDITFRVDFGELQNALKMNEAHPFADRLRELAGEAEEIARPKGLYGIAFIDSKEDDSVVIEGVRFTSRVLRVNLGSVERVFPFVATCGLELEEWSKSIDDLFIRFCADAIKESALYAAIEALGKHLTDRYEPGATSMMNPGSIDDWPAEEQGHLFQLVGEGAKSIGVELTESCVMFPVKSVSGIWFASEEGFQSCLLCPRENCPRRRVAYDPELYDEKYRK